MFDRCSNPLPWDPLASPYTSITSASCTDDAVSSQAQKSIERLESLQHIVDVCFKGETNSQESLQDVADYYYFNVEIRVHNSLRALLFPRGGEPRPTRIQYLLQATMFSDQNLVYSATCCKLYLFNVEITYMYIYIYIYIHIRRGGRG